MHLPRLLQLTALAALLSGGALHAQEQERKLLDRILAPDLSLDYTANRKEFSKESRVNQSFRSDRQTILKTFNAKDFKSKEFNAKTFRGDKAHWQGETTFDAKDARVDQTESLRRSVKEYGTKDVPVKTAYDAEKSEAVKEYAAGQRKSGYRGKSQDKIDLYGPQALDTIVTESSFTELKTIDDIRNLLNKNE